jgi:hypothetical protein
MAKQSTHSRPSLADLLVDVMNQREESMLGRGLKAARRLSARSAARGDSTRSAGKGKKRRGSKKARSSAKN